MKKLSTKFNSLFFRNIIFILLFLCNSNKIFAQYILAGQHGAADYYSVSGVTLEAIVGGGQYLIIDINGDGIDDFTIVASQSSGAWGFNDACYISPQNSNSEMAFDHMDSCLSGGYIMCHAFLLNDSIKGTLNWQGGGSQYLAYYYDPVTGQDCAGDEFNLDSMYIGVRIFANADTLYGWISVSQVWAYHNYAHMLIIDYACNLGTTGISDQSWYQHQISISPNPFISSATLSINSILPLGAENVHLKIYDMTGREVLKYEIRNHKTEISRRNLSSGIYFYKVQNKNEIIGTGKIIVQ